MASYSVRVPKSRRPFLITPYHADPQGVLRPELPERCPYSKAGDNVTCELRAHHERPRRTGPCFPLQVMTCAGHGHGFTLYPPGFGPYQRRAVLRLGPDGSAPLAEPERPPLERDFAGTLFEAAVDASEGKAWSRDSLQGPADRWWPTQGRHLELSTRLLGLAAETEDGERVKIASLLALDTLLLCEETDRLRQGAGYRARGLAIRRVLLALRGGVQRALRLLSCGQVIGQWGEVHEWDRHARRLRSLPFH
ncbi:MAG: hypothetical protein AB1486_34685 [Planctomycetota bacterium]